MKPFAPAHARATQVASIKRSERNARAIGRIIEAAWREIKTIIANAEPGNFADAQMARGKINWTLGIMLAAVAKELDARLDDAAQWSWRQSVQRWVKYVPRRAWLAMGRRRHGIRVQEHLPGEHDQQRHAGDNAPAPDDKPGSKARPKILAWAKRKFGDDAKAKAFAEWFGDSKVVDENGEPLVVYHGSGGGRDVFDPLLADPNDAMIWFSSDPKISAGYSAGRQNETTTAVWLKMERPEIYANRDVKMTPKKIEQVLRDGYDGIIRDFRNGPDAWRLGNEVEYAVFSSTQIKSATGNRGTFDPKNPKITESIADVFLAVGKAVQSFWSVGLSIFFDMRPIVDAIEADADEDEVAELIKSILFPPPTKEEAQAVIDGSGIARRWKRTLAGEGLSFPKISNQVSAGLSQGQNIQQIAKDIRPLVDNVYYRATRIARTESLRVVQELNRKASERVDDLIIGRELIATLDERLGKDHLQTTGPTGKRRFVPGEVDPRPIVSTMAFEVDKYGCPKTPYRANCRCYAVDLLRGIDE